VRRISRGGGAVPDGDGLAVSRVRFLTAEPAGPNAVRGPILASWRRSRDLKVAADQIELPYISDAEFDTPLARSAEPVLRSLREQLDGQPVSIILTDSTGLVLSRLSGNSDLERHLDRVRLAPGFSYAEQYVGRTASGPHWKSADRPTSSATSTTPKTSRTWPAPGYRFTIRSRERRSGLST